MTLVYPTIVLTIVLKIVRKLTLAPCRRRAIGAVLILVAACGASSGVASESEWHSTGEITAAAETHLRERIGAAATSTTVQAATLDSRHRLARCSEALSAFLRRGTEITARTIVGVRCDGRKPWKVYVPVDVIVSADVLVAKRTLPRGHLLSADDLIAEKRDVSRLVSGYFSDRQALLGQRLKTQLIAGKILKPSMLKADIAIRRGQTVTLTVGTGHAAGGASGNGVFRIRASGTALMDGAVNQRIRVENTQSGRVVEGVVRSREHVEVLISSNDR